MVMKFRCPQCNELYSAQEDMAGAQITCPMCFAEFELPRDDAKASPTSKPTKAGTAPADARSRPPQQPQESLPSAPPPGDRDDAMGLPLAVSFRRRGREEDRNELDMTPMVDVTFLLLIFFMVTAAFGLQKSYEVPAPDDTRPSENTVTLQELESDPSYVIVRIDHYDTFHVSAAAWEAEQEAPSKPDLLLKLRQARNSGAAAATHLLIMASEDATNGQVVTALDAGAAIGMEDVKLMTIPSADES